MITSAIAEWIRMAPVAVLEDRLAEYTRLSDNAKPRDQDHLTALQSAIRAELTRRV